MEILSGVYQNSEYYVTKIDSDTFKLSEINIQENGEQKDHFYNIKQYENLTYLWYWNSYI